MKVDDKDLKENWFGKVCKAIQVENTFIEQETCELHATREEKIRLILWSLVLLI
jgi:hypothetical protein